MVNDEGMHILVKSRELTQSRNKWQPGIGKFKDSRLSRTQKRDIERRKSTYSDSFNIVYKTSLTSRIRYIAVSSVNG